MTFKSLIKNVLGLSLALGTSISAFAWTDEYTDKLNHAQRGQVSELRRADQGLEFFLKENCELTDFEDKTWPISNKGGLTCTGKTISAGREYIYTGSDSLIERKGMLWIINEIIIVNEKNQLEIGYKFDRAK